MSFLSLPNNGAEQLQKPQALLAETTHPAAALVCLFGLFLRLVVSDPIQGLLGIDTVNRENASFLTNIHFSNYFIFLSFLILLFDQGKPLRQLANVYREHKAFVNLFLFTVLLFFYWILRGPQGVSLLIDTHLPLPLTAIVLSYAPRSYCKNALRFLALFAIMNSLMGITESLGRFRFFTFNPDWPVLKEDYFRASAWLGHPLNNAVFTAVTFSVLLTLKFNPILKSAATALLLISLVAFGGRTALSLSILTLTLFSLSSARQAFRNMTLLKLFAFAAIGLLGPILVFGVLYLALTSGMGERLMALRSFTDASAEARFVAFRAFDYLTRTDLLFGISSAEVDTITRRISVNFFMSDIENPWVLMLMQLGVVFFAVWLLLTTAFVRELMRGQTFILRLGILTYFVLASAFNSFGRKDFIYMLMVASVVCVARGFPPETPKPKA